MKKIILRYVISGVMALVLFSCSKKIDDAYANPNSPTDEPVLNIFPSLIGSFLGSSSAAGSSFGIGGDAILMGRYLQYWANYTVTSSVNGGTQFDEMGGVTSSSDLFGTMWAAFYYGHGQNLNYVVSRASTEGLWDYVGASRAIRGWGWLELGNQYANAIIVKEAFDRSLASFSYDSLQLAYDSCRQACYDALVYLNTTVSNSDFATADAYFLGGDISKWKKFTYGILARSYAYLSNTSEYKPDSAIYYANLAMTSNADNATCLFAATGISGTSNYFGPLRANVGSLRQGAYIADLMSGRNTEAFTDVTDPRLWYMLRENTDSTFYGVTPAVEGTSSLTSNLRPQNFWGSSYSSTAAPTTVAGRYLFRDAAPFPLMTASEMQFIIAEASYIKGDYTTALTAYENGINLNFDMLSTYYATNVPTSRLITSTNTAEYLANTSVVPTSASSLTLSQIMLQKYIALFGWGTQETWTDMRRYHYTDLDPVTGTQVYAGFSPAGGNLYIDNASKYVYRARPRYNSEYLYDIPSLQAVGAVDASGSLVATYHTVEPWFAR
ncbi:MAG: SusD/RagB family nutrient-binding outer membrane lipoprotein [Chitinophagaceae bacterium]